MAVVIRWGPGSGIQYDEAPLLLGDEDFVLPGSTPTLLSDVGGIASAEAVGMPTLTLLLHIPGPWDVGADVAFLVFSRFTPWGVWATPRWPVGVSGSPAWPTVAAESRPGGAVMAEWRGKPLVTWADGSGVVLAPADRLTVEP